MLLFARANIQKNALEKYGALEKILNEMETVENTLVFTAPEQIDGVLQILSSNDVLAHRITQEQGTVPETKYNGLTERQYLIECFKKKQYGALVAISCLDEGIDIPTADTAIIMASSTNPREYIQRIGRVNRIGSMEKEVFVYNFFPSSEGNDTLNLVQRAFTKLQSFHTLFGEDNRIYSDEEQISHVAYMKLIDGQETPFTKYITELHTYKQEYPERFETQFEILTIYFEE